MPDNVLPVSHIETQHFEYVSSTVTERAAKYTLGALLVALPFLAWGLPCKADDSVSWGLGTKNSVVTLRPSDRAEAEVFIENRLIAWPTSIIEETLTLGELVVHISVVEEGGAVPDSYIITPPEGYIAVPSRLTVGDGEDATVLILKADELPMG